MPPAVSDSSVLIHLAGIGRLELLRGFYDVVWIPPAVYQEVVVAGEGRIGSGEVREAVEEGWIRIVEPIGQRLPAHLRELLDEGEVQALWLASGHDVSEVLLDETEARRAADSLDLPKTGTVGILLRAKNDGLITSLKTELDRLRMDAGFWLADVVYAAVLAAADET